MTLSHSIAAYDDCFELFDQATQSSIGIRTSVSDQSAGYHLRHRLNFARTLDRAKMREVYTPDHPSFGISAYDNLIVTVRKDGTGWWVYIEPRAIKGKIEELKAAE